MLDTMLNMFRPTRGDSSQIGSSQFAPTPISSAPITPPVSQAAPAAVVLPQAAPSQAEKFQVAYDPALIQQLEQEHKAMLEIYGCIDRAIALHNWNEIPPLLTRFRSKLTDHLLKEGVKLYAFLHKTLQAEDELSFLFQSFKKEMGVIGKTVFNFFDKYVADNALASPQQRDAFVAEFKSIGTVLVSRIQREEEQLYTIYTNLQ